MKSVFVGIDLAIAKNKPLPICFCYWDGPRLIPLAVRRLSHRPPRGKGNLAVLDGHTVAEFVDSAAYYIAAVSSELGCRVERIGIDAPRAARAEGVTRRKAELTMDSAGISCFTTPSATEFQQIFDKVKRHIADGGAENRLPHANQLWMHVGFKLYERLSKVAPCIEVFPQATARAIGTGALHKSKTGAVVAQLRQAAKYTGWPSGDVVEYLFDELGFGSAHDRLDAYLSAWVAALSDSQRVAMGEPPDDVIWVPKVGVLVSKEPNVSLSRRKPQPGKKRYQPSGTCEKLCPACGKHTFKRWPFGWDAHAAHKCTGLESSGERDRRAEFREKYSYLFPGKGK
ncbi:MAG: DUF429 domain-containing protein [Pseudomonadales bacterium]|nr:DUF429 domain-containing protein [Pseudomonadales bacterium]